MDPLPQGNKNLEMVMHDNTIEKEHIVAYFA